MTWNGTARFGKCEQWLQYQNYLLIRDNRGQYYKTFYGRNLQIFIIS
jgi:hypothetical protein